MQITVDVAGGRITVTAEGQKPYQCASADECLEYLSDMLKGEETNEPGQAQERAEPSAEQMWAEEAAKRQPAM